MKSFLHNFTGIQFIDHMLSLFKAHNSIQHKVVQSFPKRKFITGSHLASSPAHDQFLCPCDKRWALTDDLGSAARDPFEIWLQPTIGWLYLCGPQNWGCPQEEIPPVHYNSSSRLSPTLPSLPARWMSEVSSCPHNHRSPFLTIYLSIHISYLFSFSS